MKIQIIMCRVCGVRFGAALAGWCYEDEQYECHACWHKKHGCKDHDCESYKRDQEEEKQ